MSAFPGRLNHKVAIITGGSSGIGRAIALAYAREGAQVVVADRESHSQHVSEATMATTEAIRLECNQKALFVQTDVCSADSIDALVAQTVREHGRLDM